MNSFIKTYWIHAVVIVFFTLIGFFVGSQIAYQKTTQKEFTNVLFTTIYSADPQSSGEEKETSAHFFSEEVLGWTISPSFTNALDFSISGRKQERGNIIFQFSSDTKQQGIERSTQLMNAITSKINTYNQNAKTAFGLLPEPLYTEEKHFKTFSWGTLGALIGFFLALVFLEIRQIITFFRKP